MTLNDEDISRIVFRLEGQLVKHSNAIIPKEFWRWYGYAIDKLGPRIRESHVPALLLLGDIERLVGNTNEAIEYYCEALIQGPRKLEVIDRLLDTSKADHEMHMFYRILRLAKQDSATSFDSHLKDYENSIYSPAISLIYRCCISTSSVEDIDRFLKQRFHCDMSFHYTIILIYQIHAGFMQYRLEKLLDLIGFLCLMGEKVLMESVDNVYGYFSASIIVYWIQDNVEILRAVSMSMQTSPGLKPTFDRVFKEILKNSLKSRHLKMPKHCRFMQEFMAIISGIRSLDRLHKLIMTDEIDCEHLLHVIIQKARMKIGALTRATQNAGTDLSSKFNHHEHISSREAGIFSLLLPHKRCVMICDFEFSLANAEGIREILRSDMSGLILPCNFIDLLDETKSDMCQSRELSRTLDESEELVLVQKGSCISASDLLKAPSLKRFDFSQSDLEWLGCVLYYKNVIIKAGNECQLRTYTLNSRSIQFLRDSFNITALNFLS